MDLDGRKAKHHGWCPEVNPVEAMADGAMYYWQGVLRDKNASISRQCIARVELEHLHKGAPPWLSEVKKT